jgi:hypothetical protein
MVLLEEVICQVVTNGVHIPMDPLAMLIASSKDCSGASASTASSSSLQCSGYLGSAIYGPLFSWINHSCRPNAYYSFDLRYSSIAPTNADCDASLVPSLNITDQIEEAWGLRFTSQQGKYMRQNTTFFHQEDSLLRIVSILLLSMTTESVRATKSLTMSYISCIHLCMLGMNKC